MPHWASRSLAGRAHPPEQALKFQPHGLATTVRRVYRVLPSGLGIVAVLLWAFRRRLGPLPHPAPQSGGAALAVTAVAVLSVAFPGFRVKIPGRAPYRSPDDSWADHTARGAALILWTLAAGAGIMAGGLGPTMGNASRDGCHDRPDRQGAHLPLGLISLSGTSVWPPPACGASTHRFPCAGQRVSCTLGAER